ncbi:alpha/beta hydrolase [Pseudomonas syringae pv. dysoxyli]|uniref:alpha/beta fold hydrolase n=1 Tax=Pseudomonas syringae TaxID=317 RepID=UPI0013736D77|nr:alpha/beta hydrolase [Pseudomonas syringae pv. dysoxyli]
MKGLSSVVCVEDFWVRVPGGRIFVRRWTRGGEWGEDTKLPIILFHDSLGCVELWRNFPVLLCETTARDVIAYDRLGFGQSDAYEGPLDANFIRDEASCFVKSIKSELQIDQYVAVGHSVGGSMAAACASIEPADCAAVVTISAQAYVEDKTLSGIKIAKCEFEKPGAFERLQKYHGDKARWVLSAWVDTWLSEAFESWTIEAAAPELKCHVLAIHGELDEYGSVAHPQRIANLSSKPGRYLIFPGCHHVPHRENPNLLVRVVHEFLDARNSSSSNIGFF